MMSWLNSGKQRRGCGSRFVKPMSDEGAIGSVCQRHLPRPGTPVGHVLAGVMLVLGDVGQ